MFKVPCAGCAKTFRIKDEQFGKRVRCPHCGHRQVLSRSGATAVAVGGPPSPVSHHPTVPNPAEAHIHANQQSTPPPDQINETWPNGGPPRGSIPPQSVVAFLASANAFLGPPEQPDELGRLGGYRVLSMLGVGGMGMVFEAEDPQLRRRVALKVMAPTVASDCRAKDRFLREARAAAALDHENIITIHQVGEDRGLPFLAMPLLKGMPLDRYVELQCHPAGSSRNRKVPAPLADICHIGKEIAHGLAAAHARGLIHRDIKPGNIWLHLKDDISKLKTEGQPGNGHRLKDDSGSSAGTSVLTSLFSYRVKILDFGLARLASEEGQITKPGTILGTPSYMAPEQARGKPVDGRADLFSLGVILYELCTGQRPFDGPDHVAILSSLAVDIPLPPSTQNLEIPPELSELVMRLLEKNPKNRPGDAHEIAHQLEIIAANEGVSSSDSTPATTRLATDPSRSQGKRGKKKATRKGVNPWIWVGTVAAFTLVAGLAIWAMNRPASIVPKAPELQPLPKQQPNPIGPEDFPPPEDPPPQQEKPPFFEKKFKDKDKDKKKGGEFGPKKEPKEFPPPPPPKGEFGVQFEVGPQLFRHEPLGEEPSQPYEPILSRSRRRLVGDAVFDVG